MIFFMTLAFIILEFQFFSLIVLRLNDELDFAIKKKRLISRIITIIISLSTGITILLVNPPQGEEIKTVITVMTLCSVIILLMSMNIILNVRKHGSFKKWSAYSEKRRKRALRKREQAKNELMQAQTERLAVIGTTFNHAAGLPIAENMVCTLYLRNTQLVIEGGGINFNLNLERITDVCFKSSVEIHKQYVSSAGGALGGALIFGTFGALIGGRVKEKKLKEVHYYMIITYYSANEEIKYIAFDITNCMLKARSFMDILKEKIPKIKQKVEL